MLPPVGSRLKASSTSSQITIHSPPRRDGWASISFTFAGIWLGLLAWFCWSIHSQALAHAHGEHVDAHIYFAFFALLSWPAFVAAAIGITNVRDTFTLTANADSLVYSHQYLIGKRTRFWKQSQIAAFKAGHFFNTSVRHQVQIQLREPVGRFRTLIASCSQQEMEWVAKMLSQSLNVPVEIGLTFPVGYVPFGHHSRSRH